MKTCNICGKSLESSDKYHKTCLKKLFGVDYEPKIVFSLSNIDAEARETIGKLSISGVQPKLSMRLNKKKRELEVTSEHGEYILKPQTQEYIHLPENENLCMTIAGLIGIDVPSHGLFDLSDGTKAYIIKRYDRNKKVKIHQENFFQILDRKDKYNGSYEEIGFTLNNISAVPGLDVQLFYERILYNFLIGNGDAHSKNFSIIYDNKDNKNVVRRLAPAYDIVCSRLVIPDEDDFALTLCGKKNKLSGAEFIQFANYLKIPDKSFKNRFVNEKSLFISQIHNSELSPEEKNVMEKIVEDRFQRIQKDI